jgi:Tautomerase enzyme
MPLVTVKVIEGVFRRQQKQETIRRITDTVVARFLGASWRPDDRPVAAALPAKPAAAGRHHAGAPPLMIM